MKSWIRAIAVGVVAIPLALLACGEEPTPEWDLTGVEDIPVAQLPVISEADCDEIDGPTTYSSSVGTCRCSITGEIVLDSSQSCGGGVGGPGGPPPPTTATVSCTPSTDCIPTPAFSALALGTWDHEGRHIGAALAAARLAGNNLHVNWEVIVGASQFLAQTAAINEIQAVHGRIVAASLVVHNNATDSTFHFWLYTPPVSAWTWSWITVPLGG